MRDNLALKKEHTLRVCGEITAIGAAEGLAENDLRTAQITALLHDVGRFEQYIRYKTFSDGRSVNHAELGVDIVRESGVLRGVSGDVRDPVMDAIAFHNRPSLPDGLTGRTALFAKLIRDADKLDIVYLLSGHYRNPGDKAVELELPDLRDLSPEAVTAVYAGRIVNFADMRGSGDLKIAQMAWVFDLNFKYSLMQFHERNYLKLLKNALPDSDIARNLYDFVQGKMMERLSRD